MAFMSSAKSGGAGGLNWLPVLSTKGLKPTAVIPTGNSPCQSLGSLGIVPFQGISDPSFFACSITSIATCSPSFHPCSTSLGNCTPAYTLDCAASLPNFKMESAASGKKYASTVAAAAAVTECSQGKDGVTGELTTGLIVGSN